MLETLSPEQAQNIEPQAIANYWQRFGLNQAPFDERTQYGMYYPLPQWQQLLQALKQLSNSNQPLMVLTGVLGSGKSTLVAQYMAQGDHQLPVCLIRGHIALRVSNVLEQIDEAFKLSNAHKNQEDLNSVSLLQLQNATQRGMIIVDDAHRMPLETLSALIQLAADQASSYQKFYFVIVGETQLQNRVQNLLDILSVTLKPGFFELKPLALEETKSYLCHRLAKAGLSGNIPFTEAMINRIQRLSGGVPGRINRVARQVLIELSTEINLPMQEKSSWSKLNDLFSAHKVRWISIALLVVLFGMAYWVFNQSAYSASKATAFSFLDFWQQKKNLQANAASSIAGSSITGHTAYHQPTAFDTPTQNNTVSAKPENNMQTNNPSTPVQSATMPAQPSSAAYNQIASAPVTPTPAANNTAITDTMPSESSSETNPVEELLASASTNTSAMQANPSDGTPEAASAPAPVTSSLQSQSVQTIAAVTQNVSQNSAQTQQANVMTATPVANNPSTVQPSIAQPQVSTLTAQQSAPQQAKPAAPTTANHPETAAAAPSADPVIKNENAGQVSSVVIQSNGEVKQLEDGKQAAAEHQTLPPKVQVSAAEKSQAQMGKKGFTVQLYAANDLSMVHAFTKKYRMDMPLDYYKINQKGKAFYVVVSGEFQTSNAAKMAVANMPASLKQLKPWIRPMSTLQEKVEMRS